MNREGLGAIRALLFHRRHGSKAKVKRMPILSRRTSTGVLVAALVLGGQAYATEARYECSGGTRLTAQFSPPDAQAGRVTLTFDTGREMILPQVVSADGGRYAGDGVEFWIKGRNATLTRGGRSETCATQ